MYHLFFRLVFQRMDPEQAHHLAFGWIRRVARVPGLRALARALLAPRHPELRVHALGLEHIGPFGLAAGFDKNAAGIDAMAMLGFDHVEIGTITAQPQPGNPKKRLFRLVEDRALINRMGFNNDGSAAVAARLAARTPVFTPVVGVNIGKTKVVPEAEAVADYVTSAERLAAYADYLVVNVSSPNTPGLRDLQAVDHLRPLLTAVRQAADRAVRDAHERAEGVPPRSAGAGGRDISRWRGGANRQTVTTRHVPLLVKIAPDLADEDIDAVADLALELGLDGIIATNTTTGREELGLRTDRSVVEAIGAGGLSGAPLGSRSLEVLRRLYARVGGQITLIGVGGVETADDVWERILTGASLVQGYSAFIYQGPFWCRAIHRGLVARLKSSPYATLADAVGAAARQESS